MADTQVAASIHNLLDRIGLFGPYWSDVSTGVIVFLDDGDDLNFARTDDKGATWATTQIEFGTVRHVACWYDKETPGDSGTLVHVAWINDITDDVFYITIDVSDGSQGTKRTVDGTMTASTTQWAQRMAITKTVSGNLIVAFLTPSEIECYKSDDGFATAPTDIADVFEDTAQADWCLLFPAATGDDNDACAMFWDISADEITLKMYDDSGNTWTEFGTPIAATAVENAFRINMDGAVRHSDSHVLVSWHSDGDEVGDDLQTADLTVDDITTPTVTAKTNIFTDQAESEQVSVWINQQTDEVRIAYLKGGTFLATVDVVFHISGDGMGSWGSEQAYSESAADDFRIVHAGRTVGNAGGRYQPSFYDDDDLIIYVNETNDVEIAAAGVAATRRYTLTTLGVG